MNKDLYTKKLAWLKQNEKPEVVLVVADNPDLIKIAIAWTNLDVKPAGELTGLHGESESEMWEWLWENARFSLHELKEKVGISFSELDLENKMKPLNRKSYYLPRRHIKFFRSTLSAGTGTQALRSKAKKAR
jgi:hypothetical protein